MDIQKIKDFLRKNGICSYWNSYSDDSLHILYKIEREQCKIMLDETDFVEELTISYPKPNDNVFSHKIIIEKYTQKITCVLGTVNCRGDFDYIIEDKTDYYINLFLQKIEENQEINFVLEKLRYNFKKSVQEILNKETVYKENVAKYSNYPNGGAYITIKSEMNENRLKELYKYPETLGWINTSQIQNYGFRNSIELIHFLSNTEEFIELNEKIKNINSNYELQLFRKGDKIVLSVSM